MICWHLCACVFKCIQSRVCAVQPDNMAQPVDEKDVQPAPEMASLYHSTLELQLSCQLKLNQGSILEPLPFTHKRALNRTDAVYKRVPTFARLELINTNITQCSCSVLYMYCAHTMITLDSDVGGNCNFKCTELFKFKIYSIRLQSKREASQCLTTAWKTLNLQGLHKVFATLKVCFTLLF